MGYMLRRLHNILERLIACLFMTVNDDSESLSAVCSTVPHSFRSGCLEGTK
jgi:hypothetical protein